jgi:hypothetical protein
MKKLLTLVLIGAFVLAALPNTMAFYPGPGAHPELAMKINGEWTLVDVGLGINDPYIFEGIHYCETFEVEIIALDFTDLYAYEFTVSWDPVYFSLVSHEVKHIHTADFVITEEAGAGYYTQAVTAVNPAAGFTGTAAIANLFFHIDNDAQWPAQVDLIIDLHDTVCKDSCTADIDNSEQDGFIKLLPVQPVIKMLPPVVYKSVVGETFEVQFEIQNIVKMKSFHLTVTWDDTQLTTDAQNVWIKDFLPPPYEVATIFFYDGMLTITVQIPCEKPPINGTGELFGIRFTTLNPWDDGDPETVDIPPYDFEPDDHPIWYPDVCWNYINIAGWIDKDDGSVIQDLGDPDGVSVKGPDPFDLDADEDTKFIYDYPCDQAGFIVGYYEFRPIPGDLDLDGHADIVDLSAIAKVYGEVDTDFDLDGLGTVDLVDVVIVAKNICRTEPDPDLPWPIFDP